MPPFTHRAPGVIGAACDNENVMVEMICDGVHLHPSTIRTSFKMFGKDRIILISDSMMATGKPDGIYSLGGQEVQVHGNKATLTVDGAIAGSVTNLFNCMKFTVKEAGLPFEEVVACATENPAKAATPVEIISGRTAKPLFMPSIDFSTISDCLANSCIPEPNPRSKEPANLANSIPESLVVRIFFKEEIVGSYLPSTFERNPEPRFA